MMGIFYTRPFTDFTTDDFNALASVNLLGFLYITQLAVKQTLQRKSGSVVTITGALADNPIAGVNASVSMITKRALNTVTRQLAIGGSRPSNRRGASRGWRCPHWSLVTAASLFIGISRSADLRSVAAGKNRLASRRSNQFSPPVCHSLRTWLSRFSIPDRPGTSSSSRPPPHGSDAPECKRGCYFSRVRPALSSRQHFSFHVLQRAYPYSLGSGPRGSPAFRGPRDKCAIHRPSLILSSRHLALLLRIRTPECGP